MSPAPTTVSTLLGHRQVAVAVQCLGSLCRLSADPVRFRVHDDGTLHAGDLESLAAQLPVESVVARSEADAAAADLLSGRAACLRFRATNPLALKLFDVLQWAGDELVYCDTDVLFLAPFRNLFAGDRSPAAPPIFLRDWQEAYALRSWQLALTGRLALPRQLNSGIIRCRRGLLDLDLVEWYLGRFPAFQSHVWVEQTCWALLAGRGAWAVDRRQIAVPDAHGHVRPSVGVHLVSSVRGLLPAYAALCHADAEPIRISTMPLPRCHSVHIVRDEVRRFVKRVAVAASRLAHSTRRPRK